MPKHGRRCVSENPSVSQNAPKWPRISNSLWKGSYSLPSREGGVPNKVQRPTPGDFHLVDWSLVSSLGGDGQTLIPMQPQMAYKEHVCVFTGIYGEVVDRVPRMSSPTRREHELSNQSPFSNRLRDSKIVLRRYRLDRLVRGSGSVHKICPLIWVLSESQRKRGSTRTWKWRITIKCDLCTVLPFASRSLSSSLVIIPRAHALCTISIYYSIYVYIYIA